MHKDLKYLISLAISLDSRHQVQTKVSMSSANLHTAQNSHASRR
jgi:hypothetical protein